MVTEDECWFTRELIDWWVKTNDSREYPWRTTKNLYEILVAEVLLQRTRRDKVKEVYIAFISRFPDPESLANADIKTVEKTIYKLGLRKRSPYLIKLAKKMIDKYEKIKVNNRFECLPGIGKYMASAIRIMLKIDSKLYPDSSIARVFSRLFGKKINVKRPANTQWVIEKLNKCSPKNIDQKRKYFLALIDLAWEICKPRKIECSKCPLNDGCVYYKHLRKKYHNFRFNLL